MLPDAIQLGALQDRLATDLQFFAPELFLCGAIVLVLLLRLFSAFDGMNRVPVAIVAVVVGLGFIAFQWVENASIGHAFTGLLMLDTWANWFRGFILGATLLVLILSRLTGLPDADDSGDFVVMLLGAALGLMLLASSNHLLMIFLAMEMASLPSYALAGFLKGRSTASEAALKYVIYGAAASGVMLFGISLITARVGTGYLPQVISVAALQIDLPLAAGALFLAVGLGYKLSIVPLHVWLPDVFEGAAAEVGAFLSVASKAAALALLGRLLWMLAAKSPDHSQVANAIGLGLALLGAVTATFGNLLAYAQTNLKRLLGYSTIAHAGFLLATIGVNSTSGFSAALVYLVAYLLANVAAFAAVAAVRFITGCEDTAALAGLTRRSPALAIGFVIALLGLLGLPPLAGFAGKFLVFESIYQVSRGSPQSIQWWIVFAVLLANTAVSAGYYLKLVRIAVLDDEIVEQVRPESMGLTVFVVLLGIAALVLGVLWSPVLESAATAIQSLGR